MAALVTLATMRSNVLDRADMENGGPVSTSQVNQRINAAIRRIYSELKRAAGDEYFEKVASFNTQNNVQTYDLSTNIGADFLNISAGGVWWITGTGVNIPIHKYTPNESEMQITGQGWTYYPYGSNIRYRVVRNDLRFVPTPLGVYSVRVHYVPTPPTLVADGDTWDGYQGFEEAVIWLATAYCQAKEEADNSFAMSMYQQEYQNILEQAARDDNEPAQVQWADPQILYGDDYQ